MGVSISDLRHPWCPPLCLISPAWRCSPTARFWSAIRAAQAIEPWQHQIEHDGVVIVGARQSRPFVAVERDIHGHRFRLEPSAQKLDDPFLVFDDPSPLADQGHEYFGFNNWESDTWFDNLVITPL